MTANQLARRVGSWDTRNVETMAVGQGKISPWFREAIDQDMLEGSRSQLVLTRWDFSLEPGVCATERKPENLGDRVRALLQWDPTIHHHVGASAR